MHPMAFDFDKLRKPTENMVVGFYVVLFTIVSVAIGWAGAPYREPPRTDLVFVKRELKSDPVQVASISKDQSHVINPIRVKTISFTRPVEVKRVDPPKKKQRRKRRQ